MSDIARELSRALNGQFSLVTRLDLESGHRFVVFSDQHKGAGDEADEFRKCESAYVAALDHYRSRGYSLILLGDVEELWEQGFDPVERRYMAVLELEASFGAGNYHRVWGNHDDLWMSDNRVSKHLAPYLPGGGVFEALRFEVHRQGERVGTILLLHGHQGTLGSDKLRPIARIALRFYRVLQRILRIGKTTPAKDACLRGKHDQEMYEWAASQRDLILIAGHTHRPVWSSRTHLDKLVAELRALEAAPQSPDNDALIGRQKNVIAERRRRSGDCNDVPKPKPCYFNTGCCKFDDGDITGIELEDGTLRLVKWAGPDSGGLSRRVVLEHDTVERIFASL